jgi:hypothetical protein
MSIKKLGELPSDVTERCYPKPCLYTRQRDVSFAEAMGTLKGFDDSYGKKIRGTAQKKT